MKSQLEYTHSNKTEHYNTKETVATSITNSLKTENKSQIKEKKMETT